MAQARSVRHRAPRRGVRPTCSGAPGRRSSTERRAGFDAGMGFTYRDPERSTDPQRAVAGARSIIVAARPYLTDDDPPRPAGAAGACRPLRLGRPLRPAACRPADDGPSAARRRRAGGRLRRRQRHRRPRGRLSRRARLVRQERQPARRRRRELVRARLRRHHGATTRRPPRRSADGCGTCRRCLDALPDRGDRRAGRDRRQSLPGLGAAAAGRRSRSPCRAGGRRPHLRLRRLPGRLPADRAPRAPAHGRRSPPTPRPWVDVLDLLEPPTMRRCSTATAAGTSPGAIRAGCGATRWWCSATSARPAMPRTSTPRSPATATATTTLLAEHARWAQRELGSGARADRLARSGRPSAGRAGRSDREAPAGDQRLPAEDRRDPVAAVGVVASAAAGVVRRADQSVRRCRRRSTPRRRSASSACPSRCCCRTRGWCGASTSWPREFGADLVVLDPAVPLGLVGPSLELPYDVVLHGAEVTVPGRLPGSQPGARQRAAPGPPRDRRPATTRRARPSGPPGATLPITVVPPGVDIERFHPLDDDERRGGARVASGCRSTASWWSAISPARAAQGLRHGHPSRGAAGADAAPTCVLAISGGGRDERRLRRAGGRARRAGALPRAGGQRRPAALYGCADVFTMLCRNRWGGLEQEGFGIVFVEAAACGVPQVAGAVGRGGRGGRRRRDRASSCAAPRTPGEVAAAFAGLLDDPARRATMGRGRAGAGRRRVLLRRARRAPGPGARGLLTA